MADHSSALQHKKRVLARLSGNDPEETSLNLIIRFFSSKDLIDLWEAIERNTHVKSLQLNFQGTAGRRLDLQPLLTLLEKRSVLWGVALQHSPLHVTRMILSSLAGNPNVQSVVLHVNTQVSVESLSVFLKFSKSVTSLHLMLDNINESFEFPMEELEHCDW